MDCKQGWNQSDSQEVQIIVFQEHPVLSNHATYELNSLLQVPQPPWIAEFKSPQKVHNLIIGFYAQIITTQELMDNVLQYICLQMSSVAQQCVPIIVNNEAHLMNR